MKYSEEFWEEGNTMLRGQAVKKQKPAGKTMVIWAKDSSWVQWRLQALCQSSTNSQLPVLECPFTLRHNYVSMQGKSGGAKCIPILLTCQFCASGMFHGNEVESLEYSGEDIKSQDLFGYINVDSEQLV